MHQDGAPGSTAQNNWGLGDSEFFVRQRVWNMYGFAVSVEPMIKLPSPESSHSVPRLGGSSTLLDVTISSIVWAQAYNAPQLINNGVPYLPYQAQQVQQQQYQQQILQQQQAQTRIMQQQLQLQQQEANQQRYNAIMLNQGYTR